MDCCLEHAHQTSDFPALPGTDAHQGQEREAVVDVVHPRCAGIDISKRDAKVCVRAQGAGRARARSTVTTWEAVTNRILALRDHLIVEEVTLVVMEATSDYWKPFYYLLEDAPFEVMLVRACSSVNSGRKGPAQGTNELLVNFIPCCRSEPSAAAAGPLDPAERTDDGATTIGADTSPPTRAH
jgi:hypothetical protein